MELLLADQRKGDGAKTSWCHVTIHWLRKEALRPRVMSKLQLPQEFRTRMYCEFPWVKLKAEGWGEL